MRRIALVALCLGLSGGCKQHPPTQPAAPIDPAARFAAGKAALANERPNEAVAAFTAVTTQAVDPALRANAWLGLGAAYDDLGNHTGAVTAYEHVTQLRPDDPDAWRALAEGLSQTGDRARQAQALDHVIALDPDDLAAYLDLAGLDVALGRPDAAKDVYLRYEVRRRDAVVALGRAKEAKARVQAATTLGSARDTDTARALVLALTDRDPAVRLACAQALQRIGVDVDPKIRPSLVALRAREQDKAVRSALDEALAGH